MFSSTQVFRIAREWYYYQVLRGRQRRRAAGRPSEQPRARVTKGCMISAIPRSTTVRRCAGPVCVVTETSRGGAPAGKLKGIKIPRRVLMGIRIEKRKSDIIDPILA